MSIFAKIRRSNIVKNGIWLYILQIFNTIIPLLTIPYITRVLGIANYGIFSSALNLIGYFQLIVEYGFNMLGIRKISMAKSKEEKDKIYSTILTCKIILTLFSFSIMIFVSLIIKIPVAQFICMVILFFIVLGSVFKQTWVFQGLQKMKYITLINVFTRTISVSSIFILVKSPNDLYLYAFLYSISFFLFDIISTFFVHLKFNIKFIRVSKLYIFSGFKEGWYLFLTSTMSKIFTSIGLTVLQFTSNEIEVGVYSALQKIPNVLILMYIPVSQVLYPYISKNYGNSISKIIDKFRKIFILIVAFSIFISLIIVVFSKNLLNLVFGNDLVEYSNLIIPLQLWMIFSIVNNILGTQILVASGHSREYSLSSIIGSISIIIISIPLGIILKMYGIAIATLIAEFILTIILLFNIINLRNIEKYERKII